MPKLQFTQEEIDGYFKERTFHHFYKKTVDIADAMATHADGKFPEKLITERRPNEPQEVMEYRKVIFEPKTKPTFSRVFSSLQKIRRSSDWSIKFNGEFPRINEEETLEKYTGENYPYFTSLTNWVFGLLLRKYLIDPNAVCFLYPIEREIPENEFLKPIATIFDSGNVIDFVEDDYCVLYNPAGSTFIIRGKEYEGRSYYLITTQQILKYDEVDLKGTFRLVDQFDHELGILPAFKLKGVIVDQVENQFLYESRIGGMISELNEAIREYSDLQAGKVTHMYPKEWEFTQNECTACKGTGRTMALRENIPCEVVCDVCQGRSYIVAGPYSKIMVKPNPNPAIAGIAQIPTPPSGVVQRDVEILKLMVQSVKDHIYDALASINFQFLEQTPMNESGTAKEVDKDELNNTVHSIAEDIVSAMDNIFRLTAYFRYKELYSLKDIDEMLPVVSVPEKFDILSSVHMQEQLTAAKTGKFNPVITSAIELTYTSSLFNTDPEIRDRLMLILSLDPLPNITEDEKMSRLSNRGITLESYIISSNIQAFVQRAIDEDEGFVDMELPEQQKILSKYAQEVMTANEPVPVETGDTGVDEQGNIIENAPVQ